ncbi:MAG: response regulator [Rickettsiales bacterium]|nr:response regulator [Rickettsiales bacterium]
MIIIKEQAEAKLLAAISDSNVKNEKVKAIQLLLPDSKLNDVKLTQEVFAKVAEKMSGHSCNLYICEDREMIIFGKSVSLQMMQDVCELIQTMYQLDADGYLKTFYEKRVNWRKLTDLLNEKIEQKEFKEKAEAHKLKQEKQQKVKDAALNQSYDNDLFAQMIKSRNNREHAEVLVVEDDTFSRVLVRNSLKEQFKVTSTENGHKAIEAYTKKAPNVMFLDIDLPDVSGHDILHKVLSIDPEAYIIMLSGNGDRENVLGAIQSGAKGFVAKPFTKDKLLSYIQRCPTIALTTV